MSITSRGIHSPINVLETKHGKVIPKMLSSIRSKISTRNLYHLNLNSCFLNYNKQRLTTKFNQTKYISSEDILKPDAVDINSLKITPINLSSIYEKNLREPLAFIIDNVCTSEECDALIQLSENDPNVKYEEVLVGGNKFL